MEVERGINNNRISEEDRDFGKGSPVQETDLDTCDRQVTRKLHSKMMEDDIGKLGISMWRILRSRKKQDTFEEQKKKKKPIACKRDAEKKEGIDR